MPIDPNTTFEISTRGNFDDDLIERARERLGRVARHCREPIDHVEIRLTEESSQRDDVRAEATLTVKHGPVRAHAIAPSANEAVDTMIGRLRGRVDRHESKLHRIGTKHDDGTASEGSWHHGDVEAAPRRPIPLPAEHARVVRRKSFANTPMSIADAILDLELLDHDFYLFQHLDDNELCLLSRNNDGSYALAADTAVADPPPSPAVTHEPGACVLSDAGAERLLASTGEPFVFYRNGSGAQPLVLYRRYDGDLGTIELAST